MSKLTLSRSVEQAFKAHLVKWQGCIACSLHATARQKVFCRGTLPAHVLFLGEAPGSGEDDTGYPFVGECGSVLDDIIANSIGDYNIQATLQDPKRQQIRFCLSNAVLCRPDAALAPERSHLEACSLRLSELILLCRPRLIVLVGKVAESAYLKVLRHLPTIIRSLGINHPGYMLRKENKDERELEKDRATASVMSGLVNVFGLPDPNFQLKLPKPLPFPEDDIPF